MCYVLFETMLPIMKNDQIKTDKMMMILVTLNEDTVLVMLGSSGGDLTFVFH